VLKNSREITFVFSLSAWKAEQQCRSVLRTVSANCQRAENPFSRAEVWNLFQDSCSCVTNDSNLCSLPTTPDSLTLGSLLTRRVTIALFKNTRFNLIRVLCGSSWRCGVVPMSAPPGRRGILGVGSRGFHPELPMSAPPGREINLAGARGLVCATVELTI